MRLTRLLMSFLAMLGLICNCAFALGKITVDPNAGSSAGKAPTGGTIDVRLAQRITYTARFKTVRQIVEDISSTTGVKLYAGYNTSDWHVRSRKMNIFVKDVKLSELMDSIAHTMKFHWNRNDDLIPPTYRLVLDRKAVTAADAQKARGDQKREELWQKRRLEWIDAIAQYGPISSDQLDSLRETDPIAYEYSSNGVIPALSALFSEVPETGSRFLAGQRFRIAANKLGANTRKLIYDAGDNTSKRIQKGFGQEPTGFGDRFRVEEEFDFVFSRFDVDSFSPYSHWGSPSAGRVGFIYISRVRTGESTVADLPSRDSDWQRFRSAAHTKIQHGVAPDEAWGSGDESQFDPDAERKKQAELLYPSEPLEDHSTSFPELEKTVKLNIEAPKSEHSPALAVNSYIASFQEELAKATGLGVVSDSWVNIEGDELPDQDTKVSELLEKFSKQFNYNWAKRSDILEFRHRMWWKNRVNQIPNEWVAAWSENTYKNGIVSLDDLARISALTYDQAEESLKADKVIGIAGIYRQILKTLDERDNVVWLRLYASLSTQLRALLMAQGENNHIGINGQMLTSEQWKLAQNLFDRIGSERGDATFYLWIGINKKAETVCHFVATDKEAGKEYRKWDLALPQFPPPSDLKTNK